VVRLVRVVTAAVAIVAAAAILVAVGVHDRSAGEKSAAAGAPRGAKPIRARLPDTPGAYLGVYAPGVPGSYAGLTAFTSATGVRPRLVVYYSAWLEPFQAGFAAAAARHGAVPLVQIEPTHVSLAAIAAGQYDSYLGAYAADVRGYGRPIILSFGHEMNGPWYPWGHGHVSPAVFVAAWRHIVMLFRAHDADNVTWLWTFNALDAQRRIVPPAPWWPGRSYVTWVGIDGYYDNSAATFSALFDRAIIAARALTQDPILISETGVAPAADQAAKIPDLFAGVHADQLLGLVWFDAVGSRDWRLSNAAAAAAFRRAAGVYKMPLS
jgi:mannan endo-1,4-beta-mannosidase